MAKSLERHIVGFEVRTTKENANDLQALCIALASAVELGRTPVEALLILANIFRSE